MLPVSPLGPSPTSGYRARGLLAARLLGPVVLLSMTLATSTTRAEGLDVAIQCWEGSTEGALITQLTFDAIMKPHGCRILVTNNSGQALDDVTFTLDFGTAPPIPLSSHPLTGGLDPGAHFNCQDPYFAQYASFVSPTGASFVPGNVLDIATDFSGYPSGDPLATRTGISYPYRGRCWEYHVTPRAAWKLDLEQGVPKTLRVEFKSGYSLAGASFATAATVTAGNLPTGVLATSPTIPIVVTTPSHPLAAGSNSAAFTVTPSLALAGSLWIGTAAALRAPNTGSSFDFYLPYLRPSAAGLELAVDGGYDPSAGHLLLFAPADLELNVAFTGDRLYAGRFRDVATGEDSFTTATPGGYAIPLEELDEDHYHLDLGYLPGNPGIYGYRLIRVSWAAAFSQAPEVQAYLAGRTSVVTGAICGRSEQSQEVCVQAAPALRSEPELLTMLLSQLSFTSVNGVAQAESSAATALSLLGSWLRPPLMPWRGMVISAATQTPNDSLGHHAEPFWMSKSASWSQRPKEYWYGQATADDGFEANLLNRTVPLGAPATFTSVGGLEVSGVSVPSSTTELLMRCEPSRYGVRNFGIVDECDQRLDWRVPRDARPSIDGSTYNASDMTRSSLGAAASFTVQVGGTPLVSWKKSFNIEVNSGSRYNISLIRDGVSRDFASQLWGVPDKTTGEFASVGCLFGNLGLDNVRGPVSIELEWPIGFEPYALDGTSPPGIRVIYGDQTLVFSNNFNSPGAPVPEPSYLVELDSADRRVVVTFDGPRPPDGVFAAEDQVTAPLDYTDARWVAVRLEGEHVPGVEHFPEWNCAVTVAQSIAPNGTAILDEERVISGGIPFRILGSPAPVLSGSSSPTLVPAGTEWTTTLDLRNAAYDAVTEERLPDGAALSARDSVLYFRVPRDGDIDATLQNGPLSITFTKAWSGDSRPIWVSTANSPTLATDSALSLSSDWVPCAPAGQPCDAAALALVGLTPAAVHWVGFAIGELLVTDANPRGVTPSDTDARVENAYYSYVTMTDLASGNDVLVRPLAVFVSTDTLPLQAVADIYDVVIVNACACADPGAYFAPVANAAGDVIGAIRCVSTSTGVTCDVGTDTDGDGRPNLVIHPEQGGICEP